MTTTRFWLSTDVNGKKGRPRPDWPIRLARSTATATLSFSTACRRMLIFRMWWPRTWTIFATARSPSGSKGFQVASIRALASCSTSSLTVILTVRANPLENNLVLWKFEKGKRSSVKWIRNTPTATHQWHDLKVRIAGTKVEGYLDGKLYLEHVLSEPVSGRIGLWSKADSHMYFDNYTVTPTN